MYSNLKFPQLQFNNYFTGKVVASGHMTLFFPKKKNNKY